MIQEQTVTFLWRCSGCPAVYDAESLATLLDDGTSRACFCGGTLTEDVGPVPDRCVGAEGEWDVPIHERAVGFLRKT